MCAKVKVQQPGVSPKRSTAQQPFSRRLVSAKNDASLKEVKGD